jgi:hypothetical protein
MALKELLVKPVRYKHKSWLEQKKEELSAEDFEWLMECLHNKRDFSGTYLAKKLTELGHEVSHTTINAIRSNLHG